MSTRAAHGAGSRTIIRREIRARRLSRVRAQARALRLWIAAVVLMACGVCGVSFEAKSRTELFDKLKECVGACNPGWYLKDHPDIKICFVNATIPGDMTQDWVTSTGENCIDEENDLNISNWNVEKVKTMRSCELLFAIFCCSFCYFVCIFIVSLFVSLLFRLFLCFSLSLSLSTSTSTSLVSHK
jgi:hypothetical protein